MKLVDIDFSRANEYNSYIDECLHHFFQNCENGDSLMGIILHKWSWKDNDYEYSHVMINFHLFGIRFDVKRTFP